MIVAVMDNITKFVSNHPVSSLFSVVPMTIDPAYHTAFASLIGGLGLQLGLFFIEFLYKKLKVKKRTADYEQSFDQYLKDKDPTQIR